MNKVFIKINLFFFLIIGCMSAALQAKNCEEGDIVYNKLNPICKSAGIGTLKTDVPCDLTSEDGYQYVYSGICKSTTGPGTTKIKLYIE